MSTKATDLFRYNSYKDSGVEWIAEVPIHWKAERAKWIFTRIKRPVNKEDDVVTVFRDGQVTLRKNRRTEGFTNAVLEIGYQGIRKGDLVINAMDAFAGAIGVSDSDGKATPVYSACVPREEYEVNNYFYAYLLRYMAISGYIESLSKGIRERSTDFRFSEFRELPLPIPPRAEQDRIVNFLDQKIAEIDDAIAKKERLIKLLQEQKSILINKAVIRGLNPNVPMKDSGVEWIGEIPAHWALKKAKYVLRQTHLPVKKGYEVVTAFRDGQVTLRSNRRSEGYTFAILEQGYQGVYPGQLVINSMDAFAGAIGVSESEGKCSPEYVVCTPVDQNEIDPKYEALLLRQMALTGYIEVICSAVRQRAIRIRFNDLARIFLVIPPMGEQKDISLMVEKIHQLHENVISHTKNEVTEAFAVRQESL